MAAATAAQEQQREQPTRGANTVVMMRWEKGYMERLVEAMELQADDEVRGCVFVFRLAPSNSSRFFCVYPPHHTRLLMHIPAPPGAGDRLRAGVLGHGHPTTAAAAPCRDRTGPCCAGACACLGGGGGAHER